MDKFSPVRCMRTLNLFIWPETTVAKIYILFSWKLLSEKHKLKREHKN